jgi:hypothetical protein
MWYARLSLLFHGVAFNQLMSRRMGFSSLGVLVAIMEKFHETPQIVRLAAGWLQVACFSEMSFGVTAECRAGMLLRWLDRKYVDADEKWPEVTISSDRILLSHKFWNAHNMMHADLFPVKRRPETDLL